MQLTFCRGNINLNYTIFVLQITNLIGDELFIQTKGSGVAQLQVIYIVYTVDVFVLPSEVDSYMQHVIKTKEPDF